MATKIDLEDRENGCTSLGEYVALAKEALAEPVDRDYAKHLLERAETQCQMPLDYLEPADVAASMLGDADYARSLYDQAEEMLFDADEHLAFARSMAEHLRDPDKVREHVDAAADAADTPTEWIAIARLAREPLGDTALSDTLLAKVEAGVHGMDDAKRLVASLLESGDTASARTFFAHAARYCDDVAATVDYAREVRALFSDDDWARKLLDDAEMECQFTTDFVALATGYQEFFEAADKVAELMEQAVEYCMTGEEQRDLAEGLLTLNGDREGAAAAYDAALADITDKDALLATAGRIMRTLSTADLAQRYYAKAEGKMSSAAEFTELARTVIDTLGDSDYAGAIYDRAIERFSNPGELANVAGELIGIDDPARARAAIEKALDRAADTPALVRLVIPVTTRLCDPELTRRAIEKALGAVKGTLERISVGVAANAAGATDLARRALEDAEEQVTSLGEICRVAEQVQAEFPDAASWIARIEGKRARREANQAKYSEFQQREKAVRGVLDLVALADAVMDDLDDRFYAQKLLDAAERRWVEGGHDPVEVADLAVAIDRRLEDMERVDGLIRQAARNAAQLPTLANLGRLAVTGLRDGDHGVALARDLYATWEGDRLGGQAHEYAKLARIVWRDLADGAWVVRLVEAGIEATADPLETAELAHAAALAGREGLAASTRAIAIDRCVSPRDALHVTARLLAAGAGDPTARALYASMRERYPDAVHRLEWAEGIVELFADHAWADREITTAREMWPGDDAGLRGYSRHRSPRARHGSRFY